MQQQWGHIGGDNAGDPSDRCPWPFPRVGKRHRTGDDMAYCVSEFKAHVNYTYSYSEYYGTTFWTCPVCGAAFTLVASSEHCRATVGVQEVGIQIGGQVAFRVPGDCTCGVTWNTGQPAR